MVIQNAAANEVEISELSKTVEAFARSVHWWNIAYLVLLGLTFVASAAVVLRNNALSRAQTDLSKSKDRIQSAKLAELTLASDELQKSNIVAQTALEAERGKRLEMEKVLAPRDLAFIMIKGVSNVDVLKPFAGTKFLLRYVPDWEPKRAATNVSDLIRTAGWILAGEEKDEELSKYSFDGVVVETYLPFASNPNAESKEEWARGTGSRQAAEALVNWLISNGWTARVGMRDEKVPANGIRINVGLKPSPYFLQKEMKEQAEEEKKRKEDERAWDEKMKRNP
jgi:hypothetical protein